MNTKKRAERYAQKYKGGYFIDMKDGMRCYGSTIKKLVETTEAYIELHCSEVKRLKEWQNHTR